MQIPILLGREIDERDVRQGAKVAVVNEIFAKTYFDNQNPIGRRFGLGSRGAPPEIEIIGVSRNARYSSLKRDIPPVAYIPYSQNLISLGQMTYELRAARQPSRTRAGGAPGGAPGRSARPGLPPRAAG